MFRKFEVSLCIVQNINERNYQTFIKIERGRLISYIDKIVILFMHSLSSMEQISRVCRKAFKNRRKVTCRINWKFYRLSRTAKNLFLQNLHVSTVDPSAVFSTPFSLGISNHECACNMNYR